MVIKYVKVNAAQTIDLTHDCMILDAAGAGVAQILVCHPMVFQHACTKAGAGVRQRTDFQARKAPWEIENPRATDRHCKEQHTWSVARLPKPNQ
jgi:hypothetical protein